MPLLSNENQKMRKYRTSRDFRIEITQILSTPTLAVVNSNSHNDYQIAADWPSFAECVSCVLS